MLSNSLSLLVAAAQAKLTEPCAEYEAAQREEYVPHLAHVSVELISQMHKTWLKVRPCLSVHRGEEAKREGSAQTCAMVGTLQLCQIIDDIRIPLGAIVLLLQTASKVSVAPRLIKDPVQHVFRVEFARVPHGQARAYLGAHQLFIEVKVCLVNLLDIVE